MRKTKFGRSLIACVLAFLMVFSTCSAALAEVDTFNYVSIGASNTNGYGMRGYLADEIYDDPQLKETANIYGYKQVVENSYPDRIADYLEENGYTVERNELAMSSMRAEEVRFLLDDTYEGDKYTDWRFVDIPGYDERASQNWFLNAGKLELGDPYASPEEALVALKGAYKTAIENADLITLDIGINNFGVYASNQIVSNMYENDLANIDAEVKALYAEGKAYVFELLEKYAGEAFELLPEAQLNHIADTMAYALVGFCDSFDAIMKEITALNPDAKVVVVSIQNLMHGLDVALPNGETISFGDAFAALINAANTYTAVLSPYADKYVYADVRKGGHVDFFMDEMLRYNGDPSTLSQDMKDCFDVYDNDLYIKTRVQQLLVQILKSNFDSYVTVTSDELNDLLAFAEGRRTGSIMIAGMTVHEFMQAGKNGSFPEAYSALLQPYYDTYVHVLNVAYDVMAEIMQAAIEINVLDMSSFGQNFGPVEDGLLGAFFDTLEAAAGAAMANPDYSFALPEGYIESIADANGLPVSFVNTVASMGVRTGIGNSFYGHPTPDGHKEIADVIIATLKNNTTGMEVIGNEIEIASDAIKALVIKYGPTVLNELKSYVVAENIMTAEEVAALEIYINEAIVAYEAENNEALLKACFEITVAVYDKIIEKDIIKDEKVLEIIELIEEFRVYLKDTPEEQIKSDAAELASDYWNKYITSNLENVNEELALQLEKDFNGLLEVVKNSERENAETNIKAYVDGLKPKYAAVVKKTGHKKYVAGEDSYYVALGGDTALGASLVYGETPYYALVAEELELDADKAKGLGEERLLSSEVLEYVEANAAEIEKADLITYQADASSFIYALVEDTPDWNRYLDEETIVLVNEIIATIEEVLATDWTTYVNLDTEKMTEKIAETVLPKLPVELNINGKIVTFAKAKVEMLLNLCVEYTVRWVQYAEDYKDETLGKITAVGPEALSVVIDAAENFVYATVSYVVDTVNAIETIQKINPEATLYVVGMYNPLRGLKVVAGENTVDAGEYFEYVIKATNLYYAGVAAANKNFAFVDASETATKGFTEGDTIDISAINVSQLGSLVLSLADKMNATAEGHKYIAEQIASAMVCKAGAYEKLNGSYHNVLCSLCGEVVEKEKHDFDGKVCTLCGYEKSGSTGSSSSGGSAIKKEETASTLKFTDVSKDAWYYDVIRKIVAKGLMNGMSETSFAPELEVTRGMFVTILYRAAGEPEITATTNFTDVAAEQYYANAVAWAAANGIVNGMSETEFAPNQNITREQMAAILYRYTKTLKTATGTEITYTDKDTISGYALDAVAWAKAAGIMEGNEDGTFAPVRNASRAEAAAVFVRLLGL